MASRLSMGDWIALILFVIIPVGIPVVLGARRSIIAWNISRHFKPVNGTIIASKAELRMRETNDPNDNSGGHSYFPVVRFKYEVGGAQYDSGTYAHPATVGHGTRSSEQRVNQIVGQFSIGSSHPAWYDPRNPGVAYLYLDSPLGGLWTIAKTLLIAGVIYVGLVVAVILLQRQR